MVCNYVGSFCFKLWFNLLHALFSERHRVCSLTGYSIIYRIIFSLVAIKVSFWGKILSSNNFPIMFSPYVCRLINVYLGRTSERICKHALVPDGGRVVVFILHITLIIFYVHVILRPFHNLLLMVICVVVIL